MATTTNENPVDADWRNEQPADKREAESGTRSPAAAIGDVAEMKKGGRTRRRKKRAKKLWIGEAMRARGLDETKVAETYAAVLDTLIEKKPSSTIEKLLVDVLKECTRLLEPPTGEESKPARIRLVHKVARPKRAHTDVPGEGS